MVVVIQCRFEHPHGEGHCHQSIDEGDEKGGERCDIAELPKHQKPAGAENDRRYDENERGCAGERGR
ncbi:hypothetical protein D3C87_2095440 [compost metagenome]